jgi:hypothetical protein
MTQKLHAHMNKRYIKKGTNEEQIECTLSTLKWW